MTISLVMKRDGRTFDHQTLEAIRLMAVERVREGESAAQAITAYGFNRTTIYKWLKAALQPGVGIKALRSTKATARPRARAPAAMPRRPGRTHRRGTWRSTCAPGWH